MIYPYSWNFVIRRYTNERPRLYILSYTIDVLVPFPTIILTVALEKSSYIQMSWGFWFLASFSILSSVLQLVNLAIIVLHVDWFLFPTLWTLSILMQFIPSSLKVSFKISFVSVQFLSLYSTNPSNRKFSGLPLLTLHSCCYSLKRVFQFFVRVSWYFSNCMSMPFVLLLFISSNASRLNFRSLVSLIIVCSRLVLSLICIFNLSREFWSGIVNI